MESNTNKPDYWFFMSRQYFKTSSLILDSIINNKNSITNHRKDYNDANTFFPLMFNFYQGIELILKGLLKVENEKFEDKHNLNFLVSRLEKKKEYTLILSEIIKYTNNLDLQFPPLEAWLKHNNFSTDKFYLFLKFPATSLGKYHNCLEIFDFGILGNEEETLPNYVRMQDSINKILKETVKIFRSYKGL